MTICCGHCGIKDEIEATANSPYLIKLKATEAGWYMTLEGKLYCPECRAKLRGGLRNV